MKTNKTDKIMKTTENTDYAELSDLNATPTFKTDFFPTDMYVVFDDDDEIYDCTLINREDREDSKSTLYVFGLTENVAKLTLKTSDLDQSAIHYPTVHLFLDESIARDFLANN